MKQMIQKIMLGGMLLAVGAGIATPLAIKVGREQGRIEENSRLSKLVPEIISRKGVEEFLYAMDCADLHMPYKNSDIKSIQDRRCVEFMEELRSSKNPDARRYFSTAVDYNSLSDSFDFGGNSYLGQK